eukprot:116867-Rhodomonas_salina.1
MQLCGQCRQSVLAATSTHQANTGKTSKQSGGKQPQVKQFPIDQTGLGYVSFSRNHRPGPVKYRPCPGEHRPGPVKHSPGPGKYCPGDVSELDLMNAINLSLDAEDFFISKSKNNAPDN